MVNKEISIHIGADVETGEPVFIPLRLLDRHMIIKGMTGSLKSVFTTYIVLQIARLTRSSIAYIDLGLDLATYHVLDKFGGRRLRFYSNGPNDASAWFDPFDAFRPLSYENLMWCASYWVTSLSLNQGEGGGSTTYWNDIATVTMLEALKNCIDEGITEPSLDDFAAALSEVANALRRNETAQPSLVLRQLQCYRQLTNVGDPNNQIQFDRAIEQGEITYAFLSGILEPMAPKIAGLMVWSIVLSMIKRRGLGRSTKSLYLVVDEFPLVAGSRSFELLLTLSRKFNVKLLLIHQSNQQLSGDSNTTDLRPIVRDNSAVKLHLTSVGDDVDELRSSSKDALKPRRSETADPISHVVRTGATEVLDPILERNRIMDISAVSGDGFLLVNDGQAHNEPRQVRFSPIFFREVFTPQFHAILSNTPPPQRMETSAPVSGKSSKPATLKLTPERIQLHKAILQLLEEKKNSENFEVR